MHHAGRKKRLAAFLLRLQERGLPEIQEVFEVDRSHPGAGLVVSMDADALFSGVEEEAAFFSVGHDLEFDFRAGGFLPERKDQRHGFQKIVLEVLRDGEERVLKRDAPGFVDDRFIGFGSPGKVPAAGFVDVIDPFAEFVLLFCVHVGKPAPLFLFEFGPAVVAVRIVGSFGRGLPEGAGGRLEIPRGAAGVDLFHGTVDSRMTSFGGTR
ncbi:MAG: hypothetical protein BWY31_04016 [Lentisphaerae bacterium ADurb.Bin242]|nr:MAG: hypothetical protein BWY31_04016 [Lentisphaerae bacterium ADurb.Bin242]